MNQRDKMRSCSKVGKNHDLVVEQYADAERHGDVIRKRNSTQITSHDYQEGWLLIGFNQEMDLRQRGILADGHVEIADAGHFFFTDTSDAALSRWNRDHQPTANAWLRDSAAPAFTPLQYTNQSGWIFTTPRRNGIESGRNPRSALAAVLDRHKQIARL